MKKIAILPIRSGSQRFVGKNFYPILGIPLYQIVVQKILDSKIFDLVIVATDENVRVRKQCYGLGIEVYQRSESSSTNTAQTEEVLKEIISAYNLKLDDWICLFQATNPFVENDYLKELNRLISLKHCNSILTCVSQKRFLIDEIKAPDFIRARTQDKQETLLETGLFWAIQVEQFLKEQKRYSQNFDLIEIKPEHDVDIDTYNDLKSIKGRLEDMVFASQKNYVQRRINPAEYALYYDNVVDPDGNSRDLINEYQGRIDFAKDEIVYLKKILNEQYINTVVEVLDVGCGTGVISLELFKNVENNITGIEPHPEAAKLARARLDKVYTNYYEEIISDIPDDSKDFILGFHCIEHIAEPNHFLEHMYRILKPGGYFLLSTPDFEGPMAIKYGKNFRLLHDPTHTSLFGAVGLLNSTLSRGFWLEKIMFPFVDTAYMTRDAFEKVMNPDTQISPPFTGNVVSLILRK